MELSCEQLSCQQVYGVVLSAGVWCCLVSRCMETSYRGVRGFICLVGGCRVLPCTWARVPLCHSAVNMSHPALFAACFLTSTVTAVAACREIHRVFVVVQGPVLWSLWFSVITLLQC